MFRFFIGIPPIPRKGLKWVFEQWDDCGGIVPCVGENFFNSRKEKAQTM
jgi:hypothetical protein